MYSFENIFICTGTESGLRFVPHSTMACPGSQHFFSHLQTVQMGNKGTFPKGDTDLHTWTLSLLRLVHEVLLLSNAPTLAFSLAPQIIFPQAFPPGDWAVCREIISLWISFFSPPVYSKAFHCFLFITLVWWSSHSYENFQIFILLFPSHSLQAIAPPNLIFPSLQDGGWNVCRAASSPFWS